MAQMMSAKEKLFVEDLERTRGQSLDFVRLGMEISVSGDRGTVVDGQSKFSPNQPLQA